MSQWEGTARMISLMLFIPVLRLYVHTRVSRYSCTPLCSMWPEGRRCVVVRISFSSANKLMFCWLYYFTWVNRESGSPSQPTIYFHVDETRMFRAV